jgi:lysophospholipase L1-like esterase
VSWVKSAAVGALVTALGLSGGLLATARADGRHRAPRIFAVGHSWVVGTSSGQQIGYVDALVRRTGDTRVEADHSGFTAPQVLGLLEGAPSCRASDLALVQVGLNDVRWQGEHGLPAFRRSLRSILQRLAGCPVILVQEPGALDYLVKGQPLRGSDAVVGDYRQATAIIARQFPNVTLVRPHLGPDDYLADGLHPDRSGNRSIASAIRATPTWDTFATTS